MYINPFLAGVLCTIVFEIIAAFLWGVIFGNRIEEDEDEEKKNE